MWLNHDPFLRSFAIFSGFFHIHVCIVGSYFVLYNFISMIDATLRNEFPKNLLEFLGIPRNSQQFQVMQIRKTSQSGNF